MIYRLTLNIFFLFLAAPVLAAELQENFELGNQYYQQGNYEQAVDKYRSVLGAGFCSGELYFNLGNSYFKLDSLGLSRLYYERAALFLKTDESLQENIALLKQRLVDKIPAPPQLILIVWWRTFTELMSISLLSWLFMVSLILLLILTALRLHRMRRGRRRQFRPLFITAMTIFIFISVVYGQKIYQLETEQFGVILRPSVVVFAEPNLSGTEVFVLHEGTKVKIERQNNGWSEIKLIDGKTGWIDFEELERI
jgi:tetratricopeptide (TPR) repeat protein